MGIDAIIELIEKLLGENGCPWDRQQTPKTLAPYLIEEMYELVDAVESGEPAHVCEELGDVLFHILFIAVLFRKMGHFDIKDVAALNTEKMIRRHPHVFGDSKVSGTDEVRKQWHTIKMKEKDKKKQASILDAVPARMPALMRAHRLSERAAKIGFDWEDMAGVTQKVEEEWHELKSALQGTNAARKKEQVSLEFGDLLFTLVNVARFARIHPEMALAGSIQKFEKRFRHMEKMISAKGRDLESCPQDELEKYWEQAKKEIG